MWVCSLPARYDYAEFARELANAAAKLQALPLHTRVAALLDLSAVHSSDPRRRQAAGQFLQDNRTSIVEHTVAWGFVIPNPLLRGAVTAIGWIGSFPVPIRMFAERYECGHWLDQQLAIEELGRVQRT